MPALENTRGVLLIISGPAGCGKTTLCERLVEAFTPRLSRVITCTTREPRTGEVDGVDYHFLSKEDFDTNIGGDAFYEHALVHDNGYGVLKDEVIGKLKSGIDLVLNIDVQGAATFRRVAENDLDLGASLVSLILIPSEINVIKQRLEGRGTDDAAEIERRLHVARNEISRWREYDYCIVSGDKEQDFGKVQAIYCAEKSRVSRLG